MVNAININKIVSSELEDVLNTTEYLLAKAEIELRDARVETNILTKRLVDNEMMYHREIKIMQERMIDMRISIPTTGSLQESKLLTPLRMPFIVTPQVPSTYGLLTLFAASSDCQRSSELRDMTKFQHTILELKSEISRNLQEHTHTNRTLLDCVEGLNAEVANLKFELSSAEETIENHEVLLSESKTANADAQVRHNNELEKQRKSYEAQISSMTETFAEKLRNPEDDGKKEVRRLEEIIMKAGREQQQLQDDVIVLTNTIVDNDEMLKTVIEERDNLLSHMEQIKTETIRQIREATEAVKSERVQQTVAVTPKDDIKLLAAIEELRSRVARRDALVANLQNRIKQIEGTSSPEIVLQHSNAIQKSTESLAAMSERLPAACATTEALEATIPLLLAMHSPQPMNSGSISPPREV